MQILHILNGDSTKHSFDETGLEGDVMVWREIFSQGPLEENISSGNFWKKRSAWLGQAFNEGPEGYREKTLDQLGMLGEPYDEINLWFEFDLHCQANLLGVVMLLKQKTDLSAPAVFLICPDDFPGKADFKGMGELNGEELEYLYDQVRVQLSPADFSVAAEAWSLYVNNDFKRLKAWINKTKYWGNLTLLKPALEAHLKRLRQNENGLNYIEQKLLDIYNGGDHTKHSIYNTFWKTEKIYGMGDWEIDLYLHNLENKQLIHLSE